MNLYYTSWFKKFKYLKFNILKNENNFKNIYYIIYNTE